MKFLRLEFVNSSPAAKRNDLMLVIFDQDGREISWAPKWAEVRALFQNATATEFMNGDGRWNDEMKAFYEAALFVRGLSQVHRGDDE